MMESPEFAWVIRFLRILYFAGLFSLLIPAWMGYRRRQVLLPSHRAVWWCCLMWTVLTILAEGLRQSGRHNTAVWNLVVILETLLLGYAFYLTLHSSKTRGYLRAMGSLFLGVSLIDFYLTGLHASTKVTVALESVVLITVVLLYFEQLLQELRIKLLDREPMFLIGVGVITYFAGTVMIFLLPIGMSGVQTLVVMGVNAILSIALNSIIARAFWLVGQKQAPIPQPTAARQSTVIK